MSEGSKLETKKKKIRRESTVFSATTAPVQKKSTSTDTSSSQKKGTQHCENKVREDQALRGRAHRLAQPKEIWGRTEMLPEGGTKREEDLLHLSKGVRHRSPRKGRAYKKALSFAPWEIKTGAPKFLERES